MTTAPAFRLLPDLYCFTDDCNVYVFAGPTDSIAVGFGSGRWLPQLAELGLPPLAHVFLLHHYPEQCQGLEGRDDWPFVIHAPAGTQRFLSPAGVTEYWRTRRGGGVPPSYTALRHGLPQVQYNLGGFGDAYWGDRRLRVLSTPGHGPDAVSLILDHRGRQVVCCGDAAHAGATVWKPYRLEWDHWTGGGALAAWEGIRRLRSIGMDLLLPAHGPPIAPQPRRELAALERKLMAFYDVKGQIALGQRDYYVEAPRLKSGARQVLPDLYQFGCNGYLLRSASGEGLVMDPMLGDLPALDALLAELGPVRITAATGSHFHLDHVDGLPELRTRYGAVIWLHPQVAAPLRDLDRYDVPWLPASPIIPDHLLPADGRWRWQEYEFQVAHFPSQTWWHAAFMATINGQRVFFGGDNFQAPSRWNGTGGFCAFNGSRFREGCLRSAELLAAWAPDLLANGHGVYFRYRPAYSQQLKRWAARAEQAVQALCPSGDLERDYYLHPAE